MHMQYQAILIEVLIVSSTTSLISIQVLVNFAARSGHGSSSSGMDIYIYIVLALEKKACMILCVASQDMIDKRAYMILCAASQDMID